MLKKTLSILLCLLLLSIQTLPAIAQAVKIPAGTPITVYVDTEIDADNVQINENINFIVQDPVYIDDKLVLKSGTLVLSQVVKLKNF